MRRLIVVYERKVMKVGRDGNGGRKGYHLGNKVVEGGGVAVVYAFAYLGKALSVSVV